MADETYNPIKLPATTGLGPIAPTDTYPVTFEDTHQGGLKGADSLAKLNAIPWQKRRRMMLGSVADGGGGTSALYWFKCPFNPSRAQLQDNQYWERVPIGIDLQTPLIHKGFFDPADYDLVDSVGTDGDLWIVESAGEVTDPLLFGGETTPLFVSDSIIYHDNRWTAIPSGNTSSSWDTLPGKPDAFPPEAHMHTIADLVDFPDLSVYFLIANIVSSVTYGSANPANDTPDGKVGNVGAIKALIDAKIEEIEEQTFDLSNYYNKSEVDAKIDQVSILKLTSVADVPALANIPDPVEGDQAFVISNDGIYRYDGASFIFIYTTRLTNAEVKSRLEANADTNTVTDDEKSAVGNLPADTNQEFVDIKDGVDPSGDTLNKLYLLILGRYAINRSYADITARDADQGNVADQENVYVVDASADGTVASGWAIYKWLLGTTTWVKIQEQESLDIDMNLYVTKAPIVLGSGDIQTLITESSYYDCDSSCTNLPLASGDYLINVIVSGSTKAYWAMKKTNSEDTYFGYSDGATITWTKLGTGSGNGGGHVILDEGTPLPQRENMDYVGDGVEATDNGSDTTIITIIKDTGAQIATKLFGENDINNFDDAAVSKLGGIEENAKDDQTGSEIKIAYEGEADTNGYTDSEKAKLASIDATHYLPPVQDIAALTALTEASLTDKARVYVEDETSDYFYDAQAVSGDEAPDDQTGGTGFWKKVTTDGETAASIKVKYESNADTNAYTNAEKTVVGNTSNVNSGDEPDASETVKGIVERATDAEATTGTDTERYITPKHLKDGLDSVSVNPVIEDAATHSVEGSYSLDLDTFDFAEPITLNADITSLSISGGTQGKRYTVLFKQGATGGTLVIGEAWVESTAYVSGDEVVSPIDKQLYECNTNHTSDSDPDTGFTTDIANWTLKGRILGTVNPILSLEEDQQDELEILVEDTDLYRLTFAYA